MEVQFILQNKKMEETKSYVDVIAHFVNMGRYIKMSSGCDYGCNADVAGYLDCPKEYRRRVWAPPYWVSKGRWFREWAKKNMPSPRPYYISTPQPPCEPRVLDDDLPF
jgi:hypothetical protein